MAALRCRCRLLQMRTLIYFCPVVSFLLSFFLRLISAVADWMSTILRHMVWPGVVASVVRRMNEVTVHWARLVLGWVTVFGPVYHYGV